jgi:hypothetical protein
LARRPEKKFSSWRNVLMLESRHYVLTKEELIACLKNEVHILLQLAGKIDKSKLDYRPTPRQRSILELVQYLAIMRPLRLPLSRVVISRDLR